MCVPSVKDPEFLHSQQLLTPSDSQQFKECKDTCQKVGATIEKYLILINVQTQRLHLFDEEKHVATYSISTSEKGTGQEENSEKTPLGLHSIQEKIGDGANPYDIFQARKNTEKTAIVNGSTSQITGRILWLTGLQEGHNKGKNSGGVVVDSYDRYIYIHGTNRVADIGTPKSRGCIRMQPDDVIALFDTVPKGTPVYIYA